jgi:hypothetical protein
MSAMEYKFADIAGTGLPLDCRIYWEKIKLTEHIDKTVLGGIPLIATGPDQSLPHTGQGEGCRF